MKKSNILLTITIFSLFGFVLYYANVSKQIVSSVFVDVTPQSSEISVFHYNIASINEISLIGVIMKIRVGNKNELSMISDSATLSRTQFNYSNNELKITRNQNDNDKRVSVELITSNLDKLHNIELNNSILLIQDSIIANNLDIDARNNSLVKVFGRASNLYVRSDQRSQIKAFDIPAKNVHADAFNNSDIEIGIIKSGNISSQSQSRVLYNANKDASIVKSKNQGSIDLNKIIK